MNRRCDALEAGNGVNGGDDIDQRLAEAHEKLTTAAKEHRIGQIEKIVATHEQRKTDRAETSQPASESAEEAEPEDQPPDDDLTKYGRFDPSSGAHAQATETHPLGGNSMTKKTRDAMWEYGSDIRGNAATKTPIDTRRTEPTRLDDDQQDQGNHAAAAYSERGETAVRGDVGAEVGRGNDRAPLPPLTWAGMNGVGKERGGTNFGAPGKMVPDQPEDEDRDTTEAEQNLREIRTGDQNRQWREQQYAALAHVRQQIKEGVAARWK
jgi:hypothetical protein